MGNTWRRPDDVVSFVHAAQEDLAEENGPDAVVDLLETDGVLLGAGLFIVEAAEGREGSLLGWEARSGWTNRLALEGLVHAFVRAVLVRRGRDNPLVLNAQA